MSARDAGPAFGKSFAARGLAIGDFNNDGRIDVLVGNNGGAPVLLRNNAGRGITGWAEAGGREMQSRRDWRANRLVGRRRRAIATEEQRRQLSFFA